MRKIVTALAALCVARVSAPTFAVVNVNTSGRVPAACGHPEVGVLLLN